MKFVNGWNYVQKDKDRIDINVRISVLTLLGLFLDLSSRQWSVTLLNFRLGNI